MNGRTAQLMMERSMAAHPQKSARLWQIQTQTIATAGTALTQPTYTNVLVTIHPVEDPVGEREAEYVGNNVLSGETKLRMGGTLAVTEKTVLLCDSKVVDIKKIHTYYNGGEVEYQLIYVARRFSA